MRDTLISKRDASSVSPQFKPEKPRPVTAGLHRPVPQLPSWARASLRQQHPAEGAGELRGPPASCAPPQALSGHETDPPTPRRRYSSSPYVNETHRVTCYNSIVEQLGSEADRTSPPGHRLASSAAGCRNGTLEEERLVSLISSRVLAPLEVQLESMERRMMELIQIEISKRFDQLVSNNHFSPRPSVSGNSVDPSQDVVNKAAEVAAHYGQAVLQAGQHSYDQAAVAGAAVRRPVSEPTHSPLTSQTVLKKVALQQPGLMYATESDAHRVQFERSAPKSSLIRPKSAANNLSTVVPLERVLQHRQIWGTEGQTARESRVEQVTPERRPVRQVPQQTVHEALARCVAGANSDEKSTDDEATHRLSGDEEEGSGSKRKRRPQHCTVCDQPRFTTPGHTLEGWCPVKQEWGARSRCIICNELRARTPGHTPDGFCPIRNIWVEAMLKRQSQKSSTPEKPEEDQGALAAAAIGNEESPEPASKKAATGALRRKSKTPIALSVIDALKRTRGTAQA